MRLPDPTNVVAAYQLKLAGEVRFIKDRSGDKGEWAWGAPGPSERTIVDDFVFDPKYLKPLAITMRSALMALGHAASAYTRLTKIKSKNISPDGSLGGRGYIQKISDMRRQLTNCVEALSSLTDTIHDELSAPHWHPLEDTMTPRDRDEVREIVQDAEKIKEDPEAWAEEEEEKDSDAEEADEYDTLYKTASARQARYLALTSLTSGVEERAATLVQTVRSPQDVLRASAQVALLRNDLRTTLRVLRKLGASHV